MLLSEKQKIDSGFFLFEAEQRAKKEKLEKRHAKRKQESSSEGITAIPSSTKTSITDKKLFDCSCYYHCDDILIKNKKTCALLFEMI